MASDKMEIYKEAMSRGQRLANAAKWADAADAYRVAVNALPTDTTARISLALALYRSGDLGEAYHAYESASKLLPKDTLLLMRMADIQHKLGRFDLATELYLRAADIYLQQKQRDKALDVWRRIAEAYSDNLTCLELLRKACAKAGEKRLEVDAELAIAYVSAEIADQKRAVQACRRAMDLDPSNEKARQMLSSIENGTNDWRSFRLLSQFNVKTDLRRGLQLFETRASEQAASLDAATPFDDLPLKLGSVPEIEVGKGQNPARTQVVRWLIAESEKFQQEGDIPSAVAVLCKAFEDKQDDEEDEGIALVKQRIDSLLGGQRQLRASELVSLPFEDRKFVLAGMLSIDDYLKRGLKMAAIEACLGVIERTPAYLPAQMRLADIYVSEGKVEAAREKYSYLVKLYQMRSERTRASEAMACLVSLHDENDALRQDLATLLMEQGSLDAALAHMMTIADGYLARNDTSEALNHLAKMLQLAPNRVDINIKYAELAAKMGKVVEAGDAYLKALAIEPDRDDIMLSYMLHSATSLDWSLNQQHLDRFFHRIADDRRFAAKVIERFTDAFRKAPGKRELRLCLGAALRSVGKLDDAEKLLRPTVGKDEGCVDLIARHILSLILVSKGKFEEALEHLNSGLEQLEEQCTDTADTDGGEEVSSASWLEFDYLQLMKSAYQKTEDKTGMLATLDRIKEIAPEDEGVYQELVGIYLDVKQVDAAINQIDQLTKLLVSKGDKQKAKAAYRNIIKRARNNLVIRKRICDGYEALGLIEEATELLESIVEVELAKGMTSDAAENLQHLVELYSSSDPRKALSARERLAKLNPEDTSCRQELIASYLKMGLASRALNEARPLAKDLIAQRRYEDAIRVVQQMLKVDPWNIWALEQLGNSLASLGRHEESIKVYKRLLSVDPQNAAAKSRIAK